MMLDSPARPVPAAVAADQSSCSVPDSEPRITKLVPPQYSDAMRAAHKAGLVDVSVYLESDGSVSKAVVTRTSGNAMLDGATYAAAIASTYAPEVRGCTYLAGSYVFRARYKADPVASNAHPTPPPSIADERPPFAPIPAGTPAAVTIPADLNDVLTTYSPSSLLTPAPERGADRVAAPTQLHPIRAIPLPTAGNSGGKAPAVAVPAPAVPSAAPSPAAP